MAKKLNGVATKIGYTGHAYDAESGYTCAQARFYDPLVGRFLSTDPIYFQDENPFTFNRFAYANNNPYKYTDPNGLEATLTLTAPDKVELGVSYTVEQTKAASSVSTTTIEAQFKSDFSGTAQVNGINVQVTATATFDPAAKTTISVVSSTQGVTQSGREEANAIGGNQVTIGATTGAGVISHELGHVSGAGDQYVGGIDAGGSAVTIPGPGNNVMQDLAGPANWQSLGEIISAPTNTNICSAGISAASGGC